MGRRRRDRNHSQKNNSIQDSVGNEENAYPDPDLNKTIINVTRNSVMPNKNTKRRNKH
jgi:hypothetical protein